MSKDHLQTMMINSAPPELIKAMVLQALEEDIQTGDITAELIPSHEITCANVMTRENMVLCGKQWVDEAFHQVNPKIKIHWNFKDGDEISANTILFTLEGNARSLLTAERTALNFLQTLSATATQTKSYVDLISHTETKLLDTRKTIPNFRIAQKYAVRCGGGMNHRIGLFDAFLIKENHIKAAGGINKAITIAHDKYPKKMVEVEVESLSELNLAIDARADVIMLDNFSLDMLEAAVKINNGNAQIEASGNVSYQSIAAIAETGVDFISVGSITKHIQAIDLSMRFI
ncbi:MAG: nicotinate-nucleotide pyrophosphorylase (carboxylating) [Francisellaceae bacterium]|jgi:nicotinate-nucleotide pyrophosphorylase (carboxylating)